ncbi:hypothetical protein KJ865_04045 [Myxococcota bacterium]|nr:hypothetical protein [Myxococcota bacterium]
MKSRSIFYLIIALVLFSCGRKESFENSDEEKKKVCDGIGRKALLEKGAVVQRPALATVEPRIKEYDKLRFSSDAQVVGGLNITSLQRLGLFRTAKENLANWNMLSLGMALLGLTPGQVVETLFFQASFKPKSLDVSGAKAYIMGNFKAADIFEKLKTLARSGRIPLTLKPTPGGLFAAYDKYRFNAQSDGDHIISVTSGQIGKGDLKNDAIYQLMKKNIPNETTLWFIILRPPTIPNLPKVIENRAAGIQYISGYINIDPNRALECQIRIRFKTNDMALSTKELVRLGFSRALNRLGPIITKSFNVDDSQNRNIVSRGPLVRLLFTLDRFQTGYLLRLLGRYLRSYSSSIPYIGGELPEADEPAPANPKVLRPTKDATPVAPPAATDPSTPKSPGAVVTPPVKPATLNGTSPAVKSTAKPAETMKPVTSTTVPMALSN